MTATPLPTDAGATPRSRVMRLGDSTFGRLLRLPPTTTDYTVARAVRVPMRDGVELLADHYAPTTQSPDGTILIRGPYGRTGVPAIVQARLYAHRGYHVVLQSARGTFGSGGVFEPGRNEVNDGADAVAWLRVQPWFTGRFATLGGSYLGFTQWALMMDPPPELAAAVIAIGPHDFSASAWGTGAFALSDFLGWSDLVAHQEDPGRIGPLIRAATAARRLRPALNALPLGAAGRALLGDRAPWYESWLEHPDVSADFWRPTQLSAALDRAQAPVLLLTGWQDTFITQTFEQFRRLRTRGVDAALTVGPWTHMQIGLNGAGLVARETFDWLAEHLSGRPARRTSPVRIFVTRKAGWRDLPRWPPAYHEKVLYLHPDAALADAPPPADASPSRFTYDPADPTPTIGGRLLSPAAGYRNDTGLAQRADVLSFTGPALAEDLDVIGTPYVELAHSADNPYVDVFVRISEVNPRGRSRNVSDGYLRLHQRSTEPLRLDLDPIAHRFLAGNRIRLLVAGGSHPRFGRNLGTGDAPGRSSRVTKANHEIALGISRLVLPVITAP